MDVYVPDCWGCLRDIYKSHIGLMSLSDTNKTPARVDSAKWTFVLNKSHRLASALYKITDYTHDREPMKWQLRDKTCQLLLSVTSLVKDNVKDSSLKDCMDNMSDIAVLLEVAMFSDSFSRMNCEVLRDEYLSLRDLVVEYAKSGGILAIPDVHGLLTLESEPVSLQKSRDRWEQSSVESAVSSQQKQTIVPAQKPTPAVSEIRKTNFNTTPTQSTPSRTTNHSHARPALNNRRQTILSFLKDKKVSGIKDIYSVVEGCSEKTVQRELAALVAEGRLRKEGERRWSTYHFVA